MLQKNQKGYKNCHRNSIKTMVRTKATVTRLPPQIPEGRIGNENILNRGPRNIPFKINYCHSREL